MTRPLALLGLLAVLLRPAPAAAQSPLSLADAIASARAQNLDALAAAAAEREAGQRVIQARAGRLPRVDFTESWQRGNQPVFVFGSLLAQRRFTAGDFALNALNHPDATANFRSAFTLEQPLFDATLSARVQSSGLGRDLAVEARRLVEQDLGVEVTRAYGGVIAAVAARRAAAAAIDAARADREIAGHRRDAGRATDADVLQIDVHIAQTTARQIQAEADERVARAALNQVMGAPLASVVIVDADTAPVPVAPMPSGAPPVPDRPEVAMAGLQVAMARAVEREARAAFLPQLGAQVGWEQNGGTWSSRASSWIAGATARVNLFRGLADRARLAESREHVTRAKLAQQKAEVAARVDLDAAAARLDAARARAALGRATVEQAIESRRIVRDRYEGGLVDVVSLLRAEAAVLDAESMRIAGHVDVLVESAVLARATGK